MLFTIILTITLDMLPHLITTLCLELFDINATTYFGPYSAALSSLESFICGLFYLRTFRRASRMKSDSTQSKTSKTQAGLANKLVTNSVRIATVTS